ncbi:MAG TPA: hypothetical protein V6C69_06910 [Trichormus sp.]|jgi:hypothetical protein
MFAAKNLLGTSVNKTLPVVALIAGTQLISLALSSPCLADNTTGGALLKNAGLPEASFDQAQLLSGFKKHLAKTAMLPSDSTKDTFLDQSVLMVPSSYPSLSPAVPLKNADSMPIDSPGPIVIDTDEPQVEVQEITYEQLPTDEGKTHIVTGARFPVVLSSELSSKTAQKGDPIEARLKYDLKIGDRLIAKKGSVVTGHINYCLKARTSTASMLSAERRCRNSGCIGISFDEIVTDVGEHLPLVATPAKQNLIINNKAEGRLLGVNQDGQVTGPLGQQMKYAAIHIGISAAASSAGVFSFGAAPAALGVIGAINPSFAFMKPVGENVHHRRLKGFVWGALSGLPGSFVIENSVVKGQEAIIQPGDELLAEFKQDFSGSIATDAMLLPGSSAKVHGQVVPTPEVKTN